MIIDESKINDLANSIDPKKGDELGKIFIQLLSEEVKSKHQARPPLIKKFIDLIDLGNS